MIFNQVLGLKEVNKDKVNISFREAVRAIIVQDKKILMVHSNKGDYKFPGGGANNEEIVKSVNKDKNPWVSRETIVLNELRLRGLIQ